MHFTLFNENVQITIIYCQNDKNITFISLKKSCHGNAATDPELGYVVSFYKQQQCVPNKVANKCAPNVLFGSWTWTIFFPHIFSIILTQPHLSNEFTVPASHQLTPFFPPQPGRKTPPPLALPAPLHCCFPPPPDKPLFCTCPSAGGGEPWPVIKYCEWVSSLHQTRTGVVSCLDPADLIRVLVGVNKGLAGAWTVYFGRAGEAFVASRNVLLPANTCARICEGTCTCWMLPWLTCASKRKRKWNTKYSLQLYKYSIYLGCTYNRRKQRQRHRGPINGLSSMKFPKHKITQKQYAIWTNKQSICFNV